MQITFSDTEIAEIVSKFYDKSYTESDIINGVINEEMVRIAILCDFEVINRDDVIEKNNSFLQVAPLLDPLMLGIEASFPEQFKEQLKTPRKAAVSTNIVINDMEELCTKEKKLR